MTEDVLEIIMIILGKIMQTSRNVLDRYIYI